MEPRDPDFESTVRASFARQAFMSTLGATLERVAPGEVEIALAHAERLTQQHGFLHAGALASIADSTCGYAALSLAPAGHEVLAVEFKISLLRPATAPAFRAHGRVLRAGRTLVNVQGEVWGESAAGRDLVAVMLSTIIVRPGVGSSEPP